MTYFKLAEAANLLFNSFQYFYHTSVDINLESIKLHGLDPKFEREESRYSNRELEPPNAIRYYIEGGDKLGLGAANRWTQVWDKNSYLWIDNQNKTVTFKIPAASILSRNFGLDLSNGPQLLEVQNYLDLNDQMSGVDFLYFVKKFHSISCYEAVPWNEIEMI